MAPVSIAGGSWWELSISRLPVRLVSNRSHEEDMMKYMLMIQQGTTPTPLDPEAWATLSEDEQQAIYAAYKSINATPGVTPGNGLQPPETATTVRVRDGKTITTDGPFVETKEALNGYLIYEADDLDAAIELAASIPAARLGGAIEVRPIMEW
jgi:hypothetical protein